MTTAVCSCKHESATMLNSYLDFWQELLGWPYPKSWIQSNPVLSASSWYRVSSQWKRHGVWAGILLFGQIFGLFSKFSASALQTYCNLSKCAQTRGCPYCQSVGSSNNSRSTGCATYFILIPSTSSYHSCVTCGTAPSLAAFLAERGYATPAFWVELEDGGISFGGFRWGMVSSFQMWVAANSCHGWIGPVFFRLKPGMSRQVGTCCTMLNLALADLSNPTL